MIATLLLWACTGGDEAAPPSGAIPFPHADGFEAGALHGADAVAVTPPPGSSASQQSSRL